MVSDVCETCGRVAACTQGALQRTRLNLGYSAKGHGISAQSSVLTAHRLSPAIEHAALLCFPASHGCTM